MNEDCRLKFKRWEAIILSGKLHGVEEEIQNSIIDYTTLESSSEALKLIIHLCHVAVQCEKENCDRGIQIYRLAHTICSKTRVISDSSKFFASIFHTMKVLMDMGLYTEARSLCSFVSPKSFWYEQSSNHRKMYSKVDQIWRTSLKHHIKSLERRAIEMNLDFLLSLMKFQLRYKILSTNNELKSLLTNIMDYITLLQQQSLRKNCITRVKRVLVVEYLSTVRLSLGQDLKYQTFESVLYVINEMLIGYMNENDIGQQYELVIIQIFSVFRDCMNKDTEYRECFELYQDFCTTLIRSFEELSAEVMKEIKKLATRLQNSRIKYGCRENAIKGIANPLTQIIDAILSNWNRYKSEVDKNFIFEPTILVNMIDFIEKLADVFTHFHRNTCTCDNQNCHVSKDLYSSVVINLKSFTIINGLCLNENLSQEIISTILEVCDHCIKCIADLQESNCKRWLKLWLSCGVNIYNLALALEGKNYNDCCYLYSLLCTSFIHLNAMDDSTSFFGNNIPPLSNVLYRLSIMQYQHGKYRESMMTSALNAFAFHKVDESKGFRSWTNVKYKYPEAQKVTIIDCLLKDKKLIEKLGLPVDLQTADLPAICFREIKALQEAKINLSPSIMKVLDQMETLNSDILLYVQAVHLLGFHLINFSSNICISKYLNKALDYFEEKFCTSITIRIIKGHLKFYKFIEDLGAVEKSTEIEMRNSKIKLYATNDSTPIEPSTNIVPAYSQINVLVARKFAKQLENVWEIWIDCLQGNSIMSFTKSDAQITMKIVITAGEYCRFYRYQNLEIKMWKLAYDLAINLEDHRAVVYIVGRSISLRCINEKWIKKAFEIVKTKLNNSTIENRDVIETIAMFKLSLSEFYFQSEQSKLAEKLFKEAMSLPKIEFLHCLGTYLYSLDITLSYRIQTLQKVGDGQIEYIQSIVKALYTMLTIDDSFQAGTWSRERFFYELDLLLNFTCHITLRMNSLFSFREITAHLVRRLSFVQKLASPIRAGEILKHLCLIDLSREKVDDCEVKVQGLEHILKIETIEMSMKSNLTNTKCENSSLNETLPQYEYYVEQVRDNPRNDSSPVLRKKVFAAPIFMDHNNLCDCFKCTNILYRFLVFSCTHIRAQLYALQNYTKYALEHFQGGFEVIQSLVDFSQDNKGFEHIYVVEYIVFLLDFSKFLKRSLPDSDDGINISKEALKLCERFNLQYNTVWITVKNLIFEFRFGKVFSGKVKSGLIVPNIEENNSSMYDSEWNSNTSECLTPFRETKDYGINYTTSNPKRRKPAPILTLENVNMKLTSSDEGISSGHLVAEKSKKKPPSRIKPVRRKISEEDYLDVEDNITCGSYYSSTFVRFSREKSLDSAPLKVLVHEACTVAPLIVEMLDILSLKDKSKAPAKIEHVEELIRLLVEEKVQQMNAMSNQKIRHAEWVLSDAIRKIDNLVDNLRKIVPIKSSLLIIPSISTISKKSSLDSITERIENMSIGTLEKKSNADDFETLSNMSFLQSDEEVVEPSIIEPRRSRRVAAKTAKSINSIGNQK